MRFSITDAAASRLAQTDLNDAEPSTDDFLAREKAILGEDASKFATAEDGFDDDDGDLLGGGGGGSNAQFEQQFPDISSTNEVRQPCILNYCPFPSNTLSRDLPPVVPSPAPAPL